MAKIDRYTGDLQAFGSGALTTERTVFGDTVQSDVIDDNVTPNYLRGWGIVGVNDFPTKQDFNAAMFTATQLLSYTHQMGVPEWDASQEYHSGSIAQDSGRLNISTANTNVGNDPSLGTHWDTFATVKEVGVPEWNALQSYPVDTAIAQQGVLYESRTSANTGNDPSADDGTNWSLLVDNGFRTTNILPPNNLQVVLTRAQYSSDVLVLHTGGWVGPNNIVVPTEPRRYYVDNRQGTYDANITTASGTGVVVPGGTKAVVQCNGTDVIDPTGLNTMNTFLHARPGFQLLPNGLIMQWGGFQTQYNNLDVVLFPVAFPNQVLSIMLTPGIQAPDLGLNHAVVYDTITNSSFQLRIESPGRISWFAIGI